MKTASFLLAVAAVIAGADSARASTTATGQATATVVSPIAVRELANLDFGMLRSDSSAGGTVTLAPGQAQPSYSGGARAGCIDACDTPHLAQFAVTGEALRSYVVAVPASAMITGELAVGASALPALTVDSFSIRSASRPHAGHSGQLDGAGNDTFELGGTLRMPADLPPAHYRVSVPVLVTYS